MASKPLSRADVLLALKRHQPITNQVVRQQLVVRWSATVALASFLPLGLWVVLTQDTQEWQVSGWVLLGLAGLGLLGLLIGWLARRRHGVHAQWGLAPLSEPECHEMVQLAGTDPAIDAIFDEWCTRWLDSDSHMRGRDLMFLRRMIRLWGRLPDPIPTV